MSVSDGLRQDATSATRFVTVTAVDGMRNRGITTASLLVDWTSPILGNLSLNGVVGEVVVTGSSEVAISIQGGGYDEDSDEVTMHWSTESMGLAVVPSCRRVASPTLRRSHMHAYPPVYPMADS